MRLETAERMRCPRAHAPTPLVLVAARVVDREVVEGTAGCPVCAHEARIRDGDVVFAGAEGSADAAAIAATSDAAIRATEPHDGRAALDRLRALLGLDEPGGAVLLTGRYARLAAPLTDALDVSVVVMEAAVAPAHAVSAVRLKEPVVPFSDGTFRAAGLDASQGPEFAADVVRSVAVGGRLVGELNQPLPPTLRELARDQMEWVAEKETGPLGVVTIRRA